MTFLDNYYVIEKYVHNELKEEVFKALRNITTCFLLESQTKKVIDELLYRKRADVHIKFVVAENKIFCLQNDEDNIKNSISQDVKINNKFNITYNDVILLNLSNLYISICDELIKEIFSGLNIFREYKSCKENTRIVGYVLTIDKINPRFECSNIEIIQNNEN
jgi:hypothetical protein